MDSDESDLRDSQRQREALREGARVAVKIAAIYATIGTVLLVPLTRFLKESFNAAQHVVSEHWYEAGMPAAIFGLFGGGLGFLMGRKMTQASGLTGPVAWGIGLGAIVVVGLAGLIAGLAIFEGPAPVIFYVALGAMSFVAAVGVSAFTLWEAD